VQLIGYNLKPLIENQRRQERLQ